MASLFIIALILFATFAISLAALLSALLVRSLCQRRRQLHSHAEVTVESVLNSHPKEQPNHLNYFLFWKKQLVRVEPAPALSTHHKLQDHGVDESKEKVEDEEEEDVVAKWQAMHGGTRFLYTIKEEDREGENSVELFESIKDGKITRLCLADHVLSTVMSEVEVSDDLWEEATPTRPPIHHTPPVSPSPSPNNN